MASAKFQGNWYKIDGEIAEKYAILVDHFHDFDGEYYSLSEGGGLSKMKVSFSVSSQSILKRCS